MHPQQREPTAQGCVVGKLVRTDRVPVCRGRGMAKTEQAGVTQALPGQRKTTGFVPSAGKAQKGTNRV